jgi:hypothetical protein
VGSTDNEALYGEAGEGLSKEIGERRKEEELTQSFTENHRVAQSKQ